MYNRYKGLVHTFAYIHNYYRYKQITHQYAHTEKCTYTYTAWTNTTTHVLTFYIAT